MDYKKIVPAVALTLGVVASVNVAQAADLFQMGEVSGHGALIACGGDKDEHHHDAKKSDKKDVKHKCASDKADDKGEHHDVDSESGDKGEHHDVDSEPGDKD